MKAGWASVLASAQVAMVASVHWHIDTIRQHCKATMTAHSWRRGHNSHPCPPGHCQGPQCTQSNLRKATASGLHPESPGST